MEEVWKPIQIKEVMGKYEVSNKGRVKSLARYDTRGVWRKEKFLKPRQNKSGGKGHYLHVCLCNGDWQKNFKIHRLVAEAFIPNPDNKPEVNHKDGVKVNNHVENLEWNTRSENCQHSCDNKLIVHALGHNHGRQKLTEEDVTFIYNTYMKDKPRSNFNANQIGRDYGVDGRAILNIYRKESWKWLTDELDKNLQPSDT